MPPDSGHPSHEEPSSTQSRDAGGKRNVLRKPLQPESDDPSSQTTSRRSTSDIPHPSTTISDTGHKHHGDDSAHSGGITDKQLEKMKHLEKSASDDIGIDSTIELIYRELPTDSHDTSHLLRELQQAVQEAHQAVPAGTAESQRTAKAPNKSGSEDHHASRAPGLHAGDPQSELKSEADKEKNVGVPIQDQKDHLMDTDSEGDDSQSNSGSEEAVVVKADDATPDGAPGSGMFGGIANVLGMRPATTKEARLEKENYRLRKENKFYKVENHNLRVTATRFHHDAYRLFHENQRLKETIESMTVEVKGISRRYEEAKSLSETRGKELQGAQAFLTKADALSMSELIQKVDALNDEIYQAAASLGETIVQKKIEPITTDEQAAILSTEGNAYIKALLGSPLYKILRVRAIRNSDEEINPLLVQITLQAFFVVFCVRRIQSWTPNNSSDNFLRDLYTKIWSSSEQAVSGRWRALTRAQLKTNNDKWAEELIKDLDAILSSAGWEIMTSEDKHTFETRLPAIFKVALDVRDAIGEKFTSADLEVGHIEPVTKFNKAYMEETYGDDADGSGKEPDMVISTVGMGLRKMVLHQGQRCYGYALNPKVVLESSLKAALEPQPARASRSKTKRVS